MKIQAPLIIVFAIALQAVTPALRAVDESRSANPSYARQVVNSLLTAYPDVVAIELHAKPPGSDGQVLVVGPDASLGRKDTEFEMRMTSKDVTSIATEEIMGKATVLVRLPLHDSAGKVIGLGVISFRPTPTVDKLMLHVRALEIFDELSRRIPDTTTLFKVNS